MVDMFTFSKKHVSIQSVGCSVAEQSPSYQTNPLVTLNQNLFMKFWQNMDPDQSAKIL